METSPFFCVMIYMNYTDGKNRDGEHAAMESLANLLNDTKNPFGTLKRDEFKNKLATMTLEDKGMLCTKVGVRPIANGHVAIMDQRLMSAFESYVSSQPIYLEDRKRELSKRADYANPSQRLQKLIGE